LHTSVPVGSPLQFSEALSTSIVVVAVFFYRPVDSIVMPSEASSSSLSSSSSTSMSAPVLVLCETDQETLRSEYELRSADLCPVCTLPIGRHLRRPSPPTSSSAVSSVSSHSSSQLGKNTTLPRWKVDYHQAKPFLDKIEHLLLADGVDASVWPRLLLKAIPNVHESAWVVTNIVNAGVDWTRAKALFTSHFEVFSYSAQLKKEYALCKQRPKESVQIYSDRFMDLVTQLSYDDANELVIDHYIEGLLPHYNAEFLRQLGTIKLLKKDRDFTFTSLKEVIDLTLSLERIDRAASGLNPSGPSLSSSSSSSSTTTQSTGVKKSCIHHPNTTYHSTEECRTTAYLARKGAPSPSSLSSPSGSSPPNNSGSTSSAPKKPYPGLKCHSCGGNHYANDPSCPKHSDRVTRSAAQRSSSPPSTSSAAIPANSSSSASAPIRVNAATVMDSQLWQSLCE